MITRKSLDTPDPEIGQVRLDRLIQHLVWVLRESPESFGLDDWFRGPELDNDENLLPVFEEWRARYADRRPLECNTTACVVGHLPLVFPQDFWWMETCDSGAAVRIHFEGEDYSVVDGKFLSHYFGGSRYAWDRIIQPRYYPQEDDTTVGPVLSRLRRLRRDLYGPEPSIVFPLTHSLGKDEVFMMLAYEARVNRCWRKVAKLVEKLQLSLRDGKYMKDPEVERPRRVARYLQARKDTQLPEALNLELDRIEQLVFADMHIANGNSEA
jgi:hypothetical protein